jgi:methionyl aminopeptidase
MFSFAAKSTWKLAEVSVKRTVPAHIVRPPYAMGIPIIPKDVIEIRSAEEIDAMRRVGNFTSKIRALSGRHCIVGNTTDAVDKAVHEAVVKNGFYPSPLGYRDFPKSCCTSVNQVVCHGIPDSRPLEDGDIINVDVSCYKDEFHGDCSATFLVGNVDAEAKKWLN